MNSMKWILLVIFDILRRIVLLMVFIISGVGVLWRFRPRDCVSVYDYFINDLGEKNPKRVFFWSKLSPI